MPSTPDASTASPPQISLDLQSATDTTRAGTAQTDTSAIARFGEDLSQATQHLLRGEWGQLWVNVYGGAVDLIVEYTPKLIGALLVFALLYAVYRGLSILLFRILDRSKRIDAGLQGLLMKTYRVVATIFIAIIVLDQLEFSIATLLAGLSIVGIAVAFAARDSLENFISGIIILTDRPFRVGDNIEVGDTFGSVEEITLRSTRVRTLNNEIAVMPNTDMITQQLINHTMLGLIRVIVPFGIAYKEYPSEAREVVLALTEGDGRLHPDYPPKVVVTGLNDSSVDMELRLYLRNPKLEKPVGFEYTEKVLEALREADIEIPFPHLQLFIDEAKAFKDSFLMQPPRNGNPPEQPSEISPKRPEEAQGKEG